MTGSASCRKLLRALGRLQLGRWALETSGKRPAAARQTVLDMNRRFRAPRQGDNLAAFYSAEDSAIAAFALAITVSARFIAALSSSLCHTSTDWPSSNDRSLASCARETSCRSASIASTSSLASSSPRAARVISSSLLHRDYGPSGSMVTTCVCTSDRGGRGGRGGQDKANWRSRTRRRWAIEKPLSAHWFLEALRLALNDIRLRPDGAFRASLRISALQAMALADLDLKHSAFYSILCA